MVAGSQLTAFFKAEEDVVAVLATVKALVRAALGSESAALVEAVRGSVVVYITCVVADGESNAKIGMLVSNLLQSKAAVSFSADGESDFIKAEPTGTQTSIWHCCSHLSACCKKRVCQGSTANLLC